MDLTHLLENNRHDQIVDGLPILLRLLENIVRNPNETRFRTINLANRIVQQKLSMLSGIGPLLQSIGFESLPLPAVDQMLLSPSVMTAQVKKYVQELQEILEHILISAPTASTPATVAIDDGRAVLGTLEHSDSLSKQLASVRPYAQRIRFQSVLPPHYNGFLHQIESLSDQVLQYEDDALLAIGRQLIPIERLTFQTNLRMRSLQQRIKAGTFVDATEPSSSDLLLAELVDWFRGRFFEWVNALACPRCGNARPAAAGQQHSADGTRIELSACCGHQLRFARYNDVALLLRTRRGRCGEFANAFTFLCRCLGYDARLVWATFDHVWTEVWSPVQRRWLHVDPSDGVIDAPLMYQHGWKRSVDYVLAYSRDGVQDVTHRYCNAHEDLKSKRTRCDEAALVDVIDRLRHKRQAQYSRAHRRYLDRRTLFELADLMTPARLKPEELAGRISGDSMWKASRGEQVANDVFVFELNDTEVSHKQFNVRYSAAANRYDRFIRTAGSTIETLATYSDWSECILEHRNVARKVEPDWKMAYLARTEASDRAELSWKFDFGASGLRIRSAQLRCMTTTYENGVVDVELLDENGVKVASPAELANRTGFRVRCQMHGGTGDNAWQHTQLFRQSSVSSSSSGTDDFPFELNVLFE